ncbi:hypothetical protein PPTG_23137 [Phytophthora nicotianae INRA-310]|uniref:Uncharacterized protein n=1 Tax=Phytophthora nicotianae (strain INRA-310) TaxID=761204 RepID=W2Q4J0_PHYN3|nr:hypothetical protein PPTG_23137 [Phytophthora nicotianae INRA-310]ETN08067.1 hypothetical protein PPTG_23137 [Phytophthora nicotianae INRA-310]
MPDEARACVWSTAASSSHRFSLQHAVDFVFVTESSAKRISKAIRDGMSEQFFILPTSAGRRRHVARAAAANLPPSLEETADRRPFSDSFFDSGSEGEDQDRP